MCRQGIYDTRITAQSPQWGERQHGTMADNKRKSAQEYASLVVEYVRNAGPTGISETLLIQQTRGSGLRLDVLYGIITDTPEIEVSFEISRGREITVYRYVESDPPERAESPPEAPESNAEAPELIGRVVGTIHADREPQQTPEDAVPIRELFEHSTTNRAPVPPVIFRAEYDPDCSWLWD